MRYTFLYKEITDISDSIIDSLASFALNIEYGKNLGFYDGKGIRTHMINDISCVQLAIDALSNKVNPVGYLNSYINILPANHYIFEHSDIGEKKYYSDNETVHKIHIPLITNQSSGHMWKCDYIDGRRVAVNFKRGKAYLFNNVDRHAAVNFSDNEDRYHLIMRYSKDSIEESFYVS